jgi:hypothetical protein
MKDFLRKSVGVFREALRDYGRAAGHAPVIWIVLAALNFAVQVYFRRQLAPGEFALLNTLIGAVNLTAVPLLALRQAIAYFPAPEGEAAQRKKIIREAEVPLVQNSALLWAFLCALFFLPALNLLGLPRFTLGIFALPNVLILLGGCFGAALYQRQNRFRFWAFLLVFAGLARLLAAYIFAGAEPWAEAGLAAGACAGLVLLTPIFRPTKLVFAWEKTRAALSDRGFRLYLGATISVMLGIFLFINADRILAQLWFGRPNDNNLGLVRWGIFDGYQTAGLLGRALLWGTQPILLVLLARRAPAERTSREVRTLFWFYGAELIGAAILLALFARPLAHLFGGADEEITAYFVPRFALAMVPLGFVQGLGFFVLASRRYPECFTLGAGGVAYTLFLALVGKPQLIQSYMFGGGTVVLLLVLSVGVVRWGRHQP